jgi:hypothetical protein
MEGSRVSHLAAADWGEAVASAALPRGSPSLLLYKGREVGDLMSGDADCDGEEETAGFDVVDRSSIVPVPSAWVSTGRSGNFGKEGAGGRCAVAAEEFVRIGQIGSLIGAT